MEDSILNFVGFIETVDFALFAKFIGGFYVIFWLFIVSWVWFDSKQRYSSIVLVLFSVLSVLVFNIFGLIIYLIVRPRYTKEEFESYSRENLNLMYESEGIGYCPNCEALYYPDFIFCNNCGYELRVKCDNCGVYVDKNWKFCPYCENKIVNNNVNENIEVSDDYDNKDDSTKSGLKVWFKSFVLVIKKSTHNLFDKFKSYFGKTRLKKVVSERDLGNKDSEKKRKNTNKKLERQKNKRRKNKKKKKKRK